VLISEVALEQLTARAKGEKAAPEADQPSQDAGPDAPGR
jgi:hypothetical protein